jgi:hypothetical protein
MFTILSKLVRKLTKSERSSLADKLVNIAKQEEQSEQGNNTQKEKIINNVEAFFNGTYMRFNNLNSFLRLAMQRGTFIGIIVRNSNGEKKMIIGASNFGESQGNYQVTLYTLGYGSSTTSIGTFTITGIPAYWKNQFETKETELVYG